MVPPYSAGVKAGNNYADHMIDTFTLEKHPNFGFLKHRKAEYKRGFSDDNTNDTYGTRSK
ncbi:MAG: hypothetical protein WAK17_25800 [Candidatus Nitrosopolaris sp.]